VAALQAQEKQKNEDITHTASLEQKLMHVKLEYCDINHYIGQQTNLRDDLRTTNNTSATLKCKRTMVLPVAPGFNSIGVSRGTGIPCQ